MGKTVGLRIRVGFREIWDFLPEITPDPTPAHHFEGSNEEPYVHSCIAADPFSQREEYRACGSIHDELPSTHIP